MKPHVRQSHLIHNLVAYGASEIATKATRLLVVMAVARTLDLAEIGMAATAIAAGDILKSLTENGVGQRIISAKNTDIASTTATAHRIFWVWCLGLFFAQSLIAYLYLSVGGSTALAILIFVIGAEYLFMPAGLVHVALAMRAGKMRQTAAIAGAQTVGANVMAIGLVLIWPSAFALVLPRLLAAPIWLIAVRRLHPWVKDTSTGFAPLMPFIRYGWAVLGVEVVKALRLQADKMIVGVLLGAEALGLYFMAFNAGLSLSNAFAMAFSTVLFPHLAQSSDRVTALRQSLVTGLSLICPLVIFQAILAPFYVPFLFGDGWADIARIVSILCLVAIPTTLWAAVAGWLRTQGRPDIELWVTVAFTAGVMVNTVVLAPFGLLAVATGYAFAATFILVGASIPTLIVAFGPTTIKV